MTARKDFTIEKGIKFYKELQLTKEDGTAKTLVGKEVKCIIKESKETATKLHELTEANGGIEVIDDTNGIFALYIPADDTLVDADFGFYDLLEIDSTYPDTETEKVLYGRITYVKGMQ